VITTQCIAVIFIVIFSTKDNNFCNYLKVSTEKEDNRTQQYPLYDFIELCSKIARVKTELNL
jgi:hypothetical protein